MYSSSFTAAQKPGLDAAEVEDNFERMSDHIKLNPTYDLGDDLLKVIGEIVVSFGQLEHAVALTIKRTSLLMTLAQAQALTNGVVRRGEDAQESIAWWAMNQDREVEFTQLMDQVGGLARRRNDVVHGVWGKDEEGRVRWTRNQSASEFDVNQLQSLRNEIHQLTSAIDRKTKPNPNIVGLSANPS